ncbi:hypothetical protein HC028_00135 [Planosporangium flavigriseum]|uniref:N-6 DNA Methylase n=1 Tax=Planosporangium flavigriseum TaxID=373681 RepID=A0A8J3PKV0_9ACTN|nr:hypothetical protein [Planosporangium flavigriseum]NJC62933.1 hypothetical protein [Planosporangium flavigriseum]GIG73202.1 hypothetical protein Pfl04_16060 [Planosporangium flavigriseum]
MVSTVVAVPLLISMPEIAELAGVQRPVVTTWRRRHPQFPAPVDEDRGRPLFDARGVVDWLVDTGRADRREIEPDLWLHLLGCLAGGLPLGRGGRRRAATLRPRELTAAITALICLRHLDDELLSPHRLTERQVIADLRERARDADPGDDLLRGEINALPDDAAWLAAAVDELVEAAWGCTEAYERVLAARNRFTVPELYADAVNPALASLIAGLSGAREYADRYGTVLVADPAAGPGDLLVAVHHQLGEYATPTFVAAEADPFRARILRRRLAVHGLGAADRQVNVGTELPGPVPDVLVTRLPYQPKEGRGEANPLAAVRDITEELGPGQTAVVLGPADLLVGALPPYRPAARTRNELLSSGRVEAVIQLPGGLVPFRPGYQTALWVLRREEGSKWQGRVLLADVSDRPLTADVVEALVWDVTTWRRNGHQPHQHLRAHAVQAAVADLIAPRRPLTTRRSAGPRVLTRDVQETIARVTDIEVELDELAATELRPAVRSRLASRDDAVSAPTQSIGALVKAHQLTVYNGYRVAAADIVRDGHHRVLGVPELTGTSAVGVRVVDRGVLAAKYPRVRLTEPDDLVVTLVPRLCVYRDQDGFSVVEFPARVLRIPPSERYRFTPRVLAELLTHVGQAGRAAGAVRAASRLDELQIPLLAPAEVARLDMLLAVIDARRAMARREIDLLDELGRLAVTGVTNGTLTMTETPIVG